MVSDLNKNIKKAPRDQYGEIVTHEWVDFEFMSLESYLIINLNLKPPVIINLDLSSELDFFLHLFLILAVPP